MIERQQDVTIDLLVFFEWRSRSAPSWRDELYGRRHGNSAAGPVAAGQPRQCSLFQLKQNITIDKYNILYSKFYIGNSTT